MIVAPPPPPPGSSAPVDGHLTELCLTAVKFARKQGNIALATRLLTQCDEEGEGDALSRAFRRLSLEGAAGERWAPELQMEKAKVLCTAGEPTGGTGDAAFTSAELSASEGLGKGDRFQTLCPG